MISNSDESLFGTWSALQGSSCATNFTFKVQIVVGNSSFQKAISKRAIEMQRTKTDRVKKTCRANTASLYSLKLALKPTYMMDDGGIFVYNLSAGFADVRAE